MGKFDYEPGDLSVSQCTLCKHRGASGLSCAAFPGGIPDDIRANHADHRRPYLGPDGLPADTGFEAGRSITFEPREDARPEWLAALYADLDSPPPAG